MRHRGEGVSPGEMFHMVGSRLITQRRVLSNDLFLLSYPEGWEMRGVHGINGINKAATTNYKPLPLCNVGWTQVPGLIMWERGGGRDISPRERRQTPAANKTNNSRRASRTGLTGGGGGGGLGGDLAECESEEEVKDGELDMLCNRTCRP